MIEVEATIVIVHRELNTDEVEGEEVGGGFLLSWHQSPEKVIHVGECAFDVLIVARLLIHHSSCLNDALLLIEVGFLSIGHK